MTYKEKIRKAYNDIDSQSISLQHSIAIIDSNLYKIKDIEKNIKEVNFWLDVRLLFMI